jgi:hypothetical protein
LLRKLAAKSRLFWKRLNVASDPFRMVAALLWVAVMQRFLMWVHANCLAVGLSVVKGPYGAFLDALQQARK